MIVRRRARWPAIATLCFGACVGPAVAQSDAALPTSSFFRNADLQRVSLSPSGRWLASTTAAATGSKQVVLVVLELDAEKPAPVVVAAFTDADVASFEWVNDERLVFNVVDRAAERPSDRFGPGLFSVKRDGTALRLLIRTAWTPAISNERTAMLSQPLEPDHELLTTLSDGSDDVIVGERRRDNLRDPDGVIPKRLNVVTGRATSLAEGTPPHAFRWLFDRSGRPKVAVTVDQGRREVWRVGSDGTWTSIGRSPVARSGIVPLAIDDQGTFYLEVPSPAGYGVVKRFDTASGKLEADALLSAPGFDVAATPIVDRDTRRLVGLRYRTDAESTIWFDPERKALQTLVDERFPGRINRLSCRRCTTDGVLLVFSYSDQDPGSYWLYRAATASWDPVGRMRKDIDPARMARLDFVRIKARDGEDLPIWVTTPSVASGQPRPAVVLVHGGPWVRGGQWSWNAQSQFLASRGYVVIEPEFRGSLGYGGPHFVKGFRQWGAAMQDDLVDATRWAIDKGVVDPARVCVAGASYGGYATLMGLVRNPETFKCGVAWVAVTDPRLLFQYDASSDLSSQAQEYSLPTLIGNPETDAALLKDAAPVEHASEIKAPLLMAFGSNDRRVPLEHGTRMRDALRKAGNDPRYVVYDGEGHGWAKVENRIDFWNRVDRFLAEQLH